MYEIFADLQRDIRDGSSYLAQSRETIIVNGVEYEQYVHFKTGSRELSFENGECNVYENERMFTVFDRERSLKILKEYPYYCSPF